MEHWQLIQRQGLDLKTSIELSKARIREFYKQMDGQVYVSFSGGKDSTVLLNLVRREFPEVPGVFVDTGLEYPEIREFVKATPNIHIIRPKKPFSRVLRENGYPVVSKTVAMSINRYRVTKIPEQKRYRLKGRIENGKKLTAGVIPEKWQFLIRAPFKISEKCCDILKKQPAKDYYKESGRVPFIGTMAADSRNRQMDYLKRGCNVYDSEIPQSRPLGFWNDEKVWEYIGSEGIPYSRIYDMGEERTGCIFCPFGCHLEGTPNRFQRLAKSHPKLWKYCIEKLDMGTVLSWLKVDYQPVTTLESFSINS